MADCTEHCELLLNDREFFEKFDANQTLIYTEEVQQKIDDMLKSNYITKQEYNFLAENLTNHKQLYFMDYQRYIKYLNYFHCYDLSLLSLIPARAIYQNLLILS